MTLRLNLKHALNKSFKFGIYLFVAWKMMRNKFLWALLHNLGMIVFVILIAKSGSSANQILLSIVAIVYWVLGFVTIFKKNSNEV